MARLEGAEWPCALEMVSRGGQHATTPRDHWARVRLSLEGNGSTRERMGSHTVRIAPPKCCLQTPPPYKNMRVLLFVCVFLFTPSPPVQCSQPSPD